MHRRNSDSNLYCKIRDGEGPKAIEPEKPVTCRDNYLDQERLAFIQSYLETADDARSMTTETSDSGMPGTRGAPSELGMEEESGKAILYLPTCLSTLPVVIQEVGFWGCLKVLCFCTLTLVVTRNNKRKESRDIVFNIIPRSPKS